MNCDINLIQSVRKKMYRFCVCVRACYFDHCGCRKCYGSEKKPLGYYLYIYHCMKISRSSGHKTAKLKWHEIHIFARIAKLKFHDIGNFVITAKYKFCSKKPRIFHNYIIFTSASFIFFSAIFLVYYNKPIGGQT